MKAQKLNLVENARELGLMLGTLSSLGERADLLYTVGSEKLKKIIVNGYDLGLTLKYLPAEQCKTVLRIFSYQILGITNVIADAEELGLALEHLSEEQCRIVLATLGDQRLSQLIADGRQLAQALENLSEEQCLVLGRVLGGNRLLRIIPGPTELGLMLRQTSVEQCGNLLNVLCDRGVLSSLCWSLFSVLERVLEWQRRAVLDSFSYEELGRIIPFAAWLAKRFPFLSEESCRLVLYYLCSADDGFPNPWRRDTYYYYGLSLSRVLEKLSAAQRKRILATLNEEGRRRLMHKPLGLSQVLQSLPEEERISLLTTLGGEKLSVVISRDLRGFGLVCKHLSAAQRTSLLVTLGDERLRRNICTGDRLIDTLESFSEEEGLNLVVRLGRASLTRLLTYTLRYNRNRGSLAKYANLLYSAYIALRSDDHRTTFGSNWFSRFEPTRAQKLQLAESLLRADRKMPFGNGLLKLIHDATTP